LWPREVGLVHMVALTGCQPWTMGSQKGLATDGVMAGGWGVVGAVARVGKMLGMHAGLCAGSCRCSLNWCKVGRRWRAWGVQLVLVPHVLFISIRSVMESRLCQVGCGVILRVICAGWVVLECCRRRGETLFDGCHQQQVDLVGFLHVSGDLTLQGVKVKSLSHFCCIRKVGVVCWRGGKGVWLVRGLGGGCWQWRCHRHQQQGVGFMPIGGVTIIGFSC